MGNAAIAELVDGVVAYPEGAAVAVPAAGLVRSSEAWHGVRAYDIPSKHTLGEAGDDAVAWPTHWPQCGCAIDWRMLNDYQAHAGRWGNRFAVAMLMDRPYFDHCYQAHGMYTEHRQGPQRPARVVVPGMELRELAVREELAAYGFPAKALGASLAYIRQRWPKAPSDLGYAFQEALRGLEALAKQGMGILIEGTMGSGKTCALGVIAEMEAREGGLVGWKLEQGEWRRSGRPRLQYVTMGEIEPWLGVKFIPTGAAGKEWEAKRDALAQVDHLFLDEYGTQQSGNDELDGRLYELFDERFRQNRPTHVATNCDLESALPKLGARGKRLWDRWQACPIFTLDLPSARQPGAWKALVGCSDER